jgi:hypothetical protein
MTINARYLVLAAALLAGCSAQAPREIGTPAPVGPLAVRMEYSSDGGASSAVPLHDVKLWMGLVTGDVFGSPSIPLHEQTGKMEQIELDLAALGLVAARYAEPLTGTARLRGFQLEPKDARIARVGTFTYDAISGRALGATGFFALSDQRLLILIYVDRPCRLYGTVPLSATEAEELDVHLPAAGFHWLKALDDDPDHGRLVLSPDMTAVIHRTALPRPIEARNR